MIEPKHFIKYNSIFGLVIYASKIRPVRITFLPLIREKLTDDFPILLSKNYTFLHNDHYVNIIAPVTIPYNDKKAKQILQGKIVQRVTLEDWRKINKSFRTFNKRNQIIWENQ